MILALPDHRPTSAQRFLSTEQLFGKTKQSGSIAPIYPVNAAAYLGPIATEDLAMFTRTTTDVFAAALVASLLVAATAAMTALGYALANTQIIA